MLPDKNDPLTKTEKGAQPHLDELYRSWGWTNIVRPHAGDGEVMYDLLADTPKMQQAKIEEKVRTSVYDDILMEVAEGYCTHRSHGHGWPHYNDIADILSYVMLGRDGYPETVYLFHWQAYRDWYVHWLEAHPRVECRISTKGRSPTVNVVVPVAEIPEKLYDKRTGWENGHPPLPF